MDSDNFLVSGYVPLIQKGCGTHMHSLMFSLMVLISSLREGKTSFCR